MATVPRSGKAAFFFRDLLCVPALFFPLVLYFPCGDLNVWSELRRSETDDGGDKRGLCGRPPPCRKGGAGGWTMDGDYEIMLGWRSRLQKSCQSLFIIFFSLSLSPSTVLLFVWAIISFSQNPPQMKWPFISTRPKTELMLLTGDCFHRSLCYTVLHWRAFSHSHTTRDEWRPGTGGVQGTSVRLKSLGCPTPAGFGRSAFTRTDRDWLELK